MCKDSLISLSPFKNTEVPTIYDGLVDYITTKILPLDVPWLLSSGEQRETPTAIYTAEGADSDKKQFPGIQNMEFEMGEYNDDGKNGNLPTGESKSTILQGAGDSSGNISSNDEANRILPGTSASFVSLQDANVNILLADGSPACSDNTVLNSSDVCTDSNSKLHRSGNCISNSQGNPDDTQCSSDAKSNRDSSKGRRYGQPSLVYLRPFVKSYTVEKDKLSK